MDSKISFIKLKNFFYNLMSKKEDNVIENKKWLNIKNKNIKKNKLNSETNDNDVIYSDDESDKTEFEKLNDKNNIIKGRKLNSRKNFHNIMRKCNTSFNIKYNYDENKTIIVSSYLIK
tara:strand:+ start:755 stop:1108 length:354 start_codon:yes stop_codon:yes gene_type:complete